MNLISQILPAERVFIDMPVSVQSDLFDRVGEVFARELGLAKKHVVSALSQREKLGSTGLGQGVAIPHGRIKGLKDATGAFLRLAAPVPFDSPDGKPVALLFILLVPEVATEQHLQILSELAQHFSDRSCREALSKAPDAQTIRQIFAAGP